MRRQVSTMDRIAAQVACVVIEFVRTRQGVDPEQVIDQFHDARGDYVLGVELDRIEEFPPGVRPASGVDQLRPAHLFIGDIAVGLQNAFELSQELLRPFASAPHAEVKDDSASRPAVLPQIGLMILPSPCLLYTSPSPRDALLCRMPSSA